MKTLTVVVLVLVASAVAVPNLRFRHGLVRRQTDSNGCNSGSNPGGLIGLLNTLGNLLSNILANVGTIRVKGILGGSDDLINLRNLLNQIRELLAVLIGGNKPSGEDAPDNEGLLTSLVGQLSKVLDSLGGAGTGRKYSCSNSGGLVGNLLEGLLTTVQNLVSGDSDGNLIALKPLLLGLLNIVGSILAILV